MLCMKYMGKGSLSSTVSSLNLFDFLQHFIIYPLLCVGSGEKSKIVQFKIKLLQISLYLKKSISTRLSWVKYVSVLC